MEGYKYFIVDIDGAGGKAEGDIFIGRIEGAYVIETGTNTALNVGDVTPLSIRD